MIFLTEVTAMSLDGGKNVTAQVVDFFTAGFGVDDIGLATALFQQFGTLDQGIVTGVNWIVL